VQRLIVGAAVLTLALVVAGCGSGGSSRARVSAYFRQVNQIERNLAPQMNSANIAFRRFSAQQVTAKEIRELKRAEGTIGLLQHRLSRLTPPKEAARIHRDLLRLVSLQHGFAKDVVRLAAYGPRLNLVLGRVATAGARLKQGLKTKSALKQTTAFREYARALREDVDRLGKLKAPDVAVPSQREEARRLARTAILSAKIAATLKPVKPPAPLPKSKRRNKRAIRRYNREVAAYQNKVLARRRTLSTLLGQLGSISSLADRRRVREEQVKAVKAFDKRLLVIGHLAGKIQRERIALERKL
jgi:hypothetical protein